jgi:integrase
MGNAAEPTGQTGRLPPWNRSRLLGQKPPLKLREVWAIRIRLQIADRLRNLAPLNMAIDSKLRGCDLVSLRVDDVLLGGRVRPRATVLQRKTARPVQLELTEQTRDAVMRWINQGGRKAGDYLFPSRIGSGRKPITTRHCARLMDGWVGSIGLDPALDGTHSLRRTKVALMYRRTGNPRGSRTAGPPSSGRSPRFGSMRSARPAARNLTAEQVLLQKDRTPLENIAFR